LSPTMSDAGANGFTLTIFGANFLNTSVVRWNNSDRPTTFVSANQLTAAIPYTDLINTASVAVTVVSPNGPSNDATFTIGPPSLVLFTEANSQRAIALDAITFMRDPLLTTTAAQFAGDNRTRVMVFSPNLQLSPGELVSSVTARGEDAQHHIYSLPVEFVDAIPGLNSITQIVFRIPDELQTADSFWVSLCYGNAASNKGLIMLKSAN